MSFTFSDATIVMVGLAVISALLKMSHVLTKVSTRLDEHERRINEIDRHLESTDARIEDVTLFQRDANFQREKRRGER